MQLNLRISKKPTTKPSTKPLNVPKPGRTGDAGSPVGQRKLLNNPISEQQPPTRSLSPVDDSKPTDHTLRDFDEKLSHARVQMGIIRCTYTELSGYEAQRIFRNYNTQDQRHAQYRESYESLLLAAKSVPSWFSEYAKASIEQLLKPADLPIWRQDFEHPEEKANQDENKGRLSIK